MGQGQRSHWPGSKEGPQERQVGSHQRQVASLIFNLDLRPDLQSQPSQDSKGVSLMSDEQADSTFEHLRLVFITLSISY